MHAEELWQEVDVGGRSIMNGGLRRGSKCDELCYVVSVLLYRVKDQEVEYLFQLRSSDRDSNISEWDLSAGGHVNYGETVEMAATRETKEEIGAEISFDKLEYVMEFLKPNYGFVRIYFYDWGDLPDDFHFDDKEVEEVRWVKHADYGKFKAEFPVKESIAKDERLEQYIDFFAKKVLAKDGNH